jgi:hypothetical protein
MRSFFVSPPGFCFADNFQYAVIFFSPPGFYFADTFFLQLRKIVRNQEAAIEVIYTYTSVISFVAHLILLQIILILLKIMAEQIVSILKLRFIFENVLICNFLQQDEIRSKVKKLNDA